MNGCPASPDLDLAGGIALAVRRGEVSAVEIASAFLEKIRAENGRINAFTDITADRALAQARAIDVARTAGEPLGPLAGVPFAVKNLFDIEGVVTRAGSKINRENEPASADAVLVRRLCEAGAVLTGALNMGEYAYDFTGENAHDGPTRNPHDLTRMTGGSSSGSAAATAAGLAPLSLGSDTNGSLRVPASLCGVFSLKPTYGRLPRTGTFPFVDSLDHLGPFARSVQDLVLAYDAMRGHDPGDHACSDRPSRALAPDLAQGIADLRIGVPQGLFTSNAGPDARHAIGLVEKALQGSASVRHLVLDEARYGRAAAYLVTNAESSALHLERVRSRASDFDPETRDRFIAGALLPAQWLLKAQRIRRWWLRKALEIFQDVDLLAVAATPFTAPAIGQKFLDLGGQTVVLRPHLGIFAQPFSCIGLPIVTVPVFEPGLMPIGVQLIAAPWREDLPLRAAGWLESHGVARAHPPPPARMPAVGTGTKRCGPENASNPARVSF